MKTGNVSFPQVQIHSTPFVNMSFTNKMKVIKTEEGFCICCSDVRDCAHASHTSAQVLLENVLHWQHRQYLSPITWITVDRWEAGPCRPCQVCVWLHKCVLGTGRYLPITAIDFHAGVSRLKMLILTVSLNPPEADRGFLFVYATTITAHTALIRLQSFATQINENMSIWILVCLGNAHTEKEREMLQLCTLLFAYRCMNVFRSEGDVDLFSAMHCSPG